MFLISVVFSLITTLILVWIISLFGKKSFVLKKFLLEPDNECDNIVTIVARKSGFFAWLLTHLFKISPETSLSATTKDICFMYKSISTEENALITLKKGISHVYCKYQKPLWILVLSILYLLGGIIVFIIQKINYYDILKNDYYAFSDSILMITSLVPTFVISITLFFIFYFKKSIVIMIETIGGTKYSIQFKPSFIEGQDVNLKKAQEVVKVIQDHIIMEQL